MNNNLVSIITPVYNSEKFIEDAIQSVIAQTYENWEMIIVDDCSTDNSANIVKKIVCQDNRIKLIENKTNQGAAITRNIALKNAKGRFIAFLDSDDIWEKDKLEIQLNFMKTVNAPISFTSYRLIDEKGNNLNHIIKSVPKLTLTDYLKNTIIGCSTAMVDKNQSGDFQFINIRTRQDTHLWITLFKRGLKAYGIDNVLVKYRVRTNSISANKLKAAKQVWNLYYNIENLGFCKSCYYFSFYAYNALKKRRFSG